MSIPAFYSGTGRRKTAIARVRLLPGEVPGQQADSHEQVRRGHEARDDPCAHVTPR